MTASQTLQLRAFDEQLAQQSSRVGNLTCNGRKTRVIPGTVRSTRLLQETGYLPNELSAIDIKRTDFQRLNITHKSTLVLDGDQMRPIEINDDPTDAVVNVTLAKRH